MAEKNITPGDWVRFMLNNRLVIGKVEYVKTFPYSPRVEVVTDAGRIYAVDVLEVRAPHTEERG